jgi:5-methylcytosine-specific restriction protein A
MRSITQKPDIKKERRFYDSVRWRKAAKWFLAENPLCVLCAVIGRTTGATTVDHIEPHRGDYNKFWDVNNWQSVCKTCHENAKKMQEIHGYSQASDGSGMPVDSNHPWNRRKLCVEDPNQDRER